MSAKELFMDWNDREFTLFHILVEFETIPTQICSPYFPRNLTSRE